MAAAVGRWTGAANAAIGKPECDASAPKAGSCELKALEARGVGNGATLLSHVCAWRSNGWSRQWCSGGARAPEGPSCRSGCTSATGRGGEGARDDPLLPFALGAYEQSSLEAAGSADGGCGCEPASCGGDLASAADGLTCQLDSVICRRLLPGVVDASTSMGSLASFVGVAGALSASAAALSALAAAIAAAASLASRAAARSEAFRGVGGAFGAFLSASLYALLLATMVSMSSPLPGGSLRQVGQR